jgi:hypothetical protein
MHSFCCHVSTCTDGGARHVFAFVTMPGGLSGDGDGGGDGGDGSGGDIGYGDGGGDEYGCGGYGG